MISEVQPQPNPEQLQNGISDRTDTISTDSSGEVRNLIRREQRQGDVISYVSFVKPQKFNMQSTSGCPNTFQKHVQCGLLLSALCLDAWRKICKESRKPIIKNKFRSLSY